MTKYQVIMAMYRLLEESFNEESSEEYGDFLSGLDPFLWTDGKTADPDIYDEFSALADEKGLTGDISSIQALSLVSDYVEAQGIPDMSAVIDNTDAGHWNEIISELTANVTKKFSCDCCGYFTLEEKDHSLVCPVCYWEDDKTQRLDPSFAGGANKMSLDEARQNFSVWGACDEKVIPFTRMPTAEEVSGLVAQPDDSEV